MHIPELVHLAVCLQCPVVLHRKGAAVAHPQRAHCFRASHDAAKLQAAGLDSEIWEVDFSPKLDILHIRMVPNHVYLQNLLFFPAVKLQFVSWVKCDVDMAGLLYTHSHRLQGDGQ